MSYRRPFPPGCEEELTNKGRKSSLQRQKDEERKLYEQLFYFPPVPSLGKYDRDPWAHHPLMSYFGHKEKMKQDDEAIIRHGKKIKSYVANKIQKEKGVRDRDDSQNLESFLTQEDFVEFLRDSVRSAPVVPMQNRWEKRIISYVPKRYQDMHPTLFLTLVKDMKNRYDAVLHESILNFVIAPSSEAPSKIPHLEAEMKLPLFSTKPPPWAKSFKRSRQAVHKDLRLLHPLVLKTFLKFREHVYAKKLFDVQSEVSNMDKIKPFDLKDMIISQIQSRGGEILEKFIPLLTYLYQNAASLNMLPQDKANDILNCASNMIQCNATYYVMKTVEEVLYLYENYQRQLPTIVLDSGVEDSRRIGFFPGMEDSVFFLKLIVSEAVDMTQRIPDVYALYHSGLTQEAPSSFCKVILPTPFLDKVFERYIKVMNQWLSGPTDYIEEIHKQFQHVLSSEAREEAFSFTMDEEKTFYEGVDQLKYYKQLMDMCYEIPKTEFFKTIHLNNEDLILGLSEVCRYHFNIYLNHLTQTYGKHNASILQGFEDVKTKLLREPKTTKEVVELAEYIDEARGSILTELKEQITEGMKMFFALLDFHLLNAEDRKTSIKVQTMHRSIIPVFEKSAIMIEDKKTEFEDRLSEKIEEMKLDLSKLCRRVKEDFSRNGDYNSVGKYMQDLKYVHKRVAALEDQIEWINSEEALFKFSLSVFIDMSEIKNHLEPYTRLYSIVHKWQKAEKKYMDGDFHLEAARIDQETEDYFKELYKLQKLFKSRIKAEKQLEAERRRVPLTLLYDEDNLEQIPPPLKICNQGMQSLTHFRTYLPTIEVLCNPGLRPRHWEKMSQIYGKDLTPDTGTSLRKFLGMGFDPYMTRFESVSLAATKEHALDSAVDAMKQEWENAVLSTIQYKDTPVKILASVEEIQLLLEDHIQQTQTMKGSPFVKPHEAKVKAWEEALLRAQSTLDEWLVVQAHWMYLEPVFSSEDIQGQMPEEGKMFKRVDATWRGLMSDLGSQPNAIETAAQPGLYERFVDCVAALDKINKGLNNYLETKRLYFPRFFFLSNDEMLEILSETKDPKRVQPHLKKCFEGISHLELDDDLIIHAMFSSEGEKVEFSEVIDPLDAKGCVEKWLVEVENMMIRSLRDVVSTSKDAYVHNPRIEWVLKWPGQVVLCVTQIYWTSEVHEALEAKVIQNYTQRLNAQLSQIVELVRGKLSKQNRVTLEALITIDVHARDVVDDMVKANIQDEDDFAWLAQLRYYMENFIVNVRITNAMVVYGYEYLGNTTRLVITPLTDRCYRTLIGAYHLLKFGAPEGPAGTGKTETTKDLAKAVAVYCVVFNCSEGLDYLAMGKFFKGLASCGAWACFDEFNRIELEVLSVIAQQILSILRAKQANLETFVFEGTELRINHACYVCITMNPGYAGRSELPDNLKVSFRTVAMMVPDYSLIGEIALYSSGFLDARNLSVKIVTTYRLCSEQLSSQFHYDYGMRAVKSVLLAAANLKQKFPDENEDILVLRSIIDVNLPKFLSPDIPLFEGIISDIFPGVKLPQADYTNLYHAVELSCSTRNLQPVEVFKIKVVQMYEMMLVRHGFMLVGDPFGGKTCVIKVLRDALNYMHDNDQGESRVIYETLNAKSIPLSQLYGNFDPVSHEWSDGVIATLFRNFALAKTQERKWLIFDSPVDAVWIESMNTVLDDNKKLCLLSGEIISMTAVMSMVFEVMDLSQASPATVSRCGMIYFQPSSLGWRVLVRSWVDGLEEIWKTGEDTEAFIYDLCEWILDSTLYFVQKSCKNLVQIGDSVFANSFLRLTKAQMDEGTKELEKESKFLKLWVTAAVLFSTVWAIGGILDTDSRVKYDTFIRSVTSGKDPAFPLPKTLPAKFETSYPPDGSIYDWQYEIKGRGQWRHWNEMVRNFEMPSHTDIRRIIVPTIDTARYTYLIDLAVKHEIPLLLVGPTGTGKSAYVQEKLMNGIPLNKYLATFITFSAQITSIQTLDLIMGKLDKKGRGRYGPPPGKKCIVFIDDLNLPTKEIYGAQPPIELLRQYFDHKQLYDRKDNSKIYLQNMQFLAAMGPPGGSRHDITARFIRHFNVVAINTFSDETMIRIFQNLLQIYLRNSGFSPEYFSIIHPIVGSTLDVYKEAMVKLLPTPSKSHYTFNLRDFSRVVQGICLINKNTVDSKKLFVRLWTHEVFRVFYDRLVDDKDRAWLFELSKTCVQTHFKESFDALFEHIASAGPKSKVTEEDMKDLMFGDFMNPDADAEDRLYQEIRDIDQFFKIAHLSLNEYNETNKNQMNLVIFRYLLEHLSRVCRILCSPGGHGLLVGVGGSGRQSLTRLAACMEGHQIFQPEISKNYGRSEWRDDLKKGMKNAGAYNRQTVLLISDSQIKEEGFLEDVDSLLNSGDVPNIFNAEEKGEIMEAVMPALIGQMEKKKGDSDINPLALFSFFVDRVKAKLHIIIAFSPIGSAFRNRLRLFPSLVNCCTIDWFQPWPDDALQKVAQTSLEGMDIPPELKKGAVSICKFFHTRAEALAKKFLVELKRFVYVTPTSFLELILTFKQVIQGKKDSTMNAIKRYLGGLEKLDFAAKEIAVMKKELTALQPQLVEAAKQTDAMMETIERESIEVEKKSALVREDEAVAHVQAEEATSLKQECMADLAEALPLLDKALKALDTLKPADIVLVKSMKNPPPVVKLVMAAVCVMKGIKPEKTKDADGRPIMDFWGPSKRLMADFNFLQSLKDYDKDNIPEQTMNEIRKNFITQDLFKPSKVAKASSAAEGLCKWVLAMESYDKVAKVVAPKKARLNEAESKLKDTLDLLNMKRREVVELETRLAALKEQLDLTNKKKEKLEAEVLLCTQKLDRAEKLIGGLGGEKTRWIQAAQDLQTVYDNLGADVLIASACAAYLGPYTANFRNECIVDWIKFVSDLGISCSQDFSLSRTLGSPITIQQWNLAGLPRDSFSIDNAVMVECARRFPLMIDPQGQANKWIKNSEKHLGLRITKLADSDFMKKMEACIGQGFPILVENVGEDIDPTLQPILQKNTFKQGGVAMIRLGDIVVEFSPFFRLYMTTKLRNPHYLPDISTKVLLLNFMITPEGLEDQLLGIVVAKERPELEEERQQLVQLSASNAKGLKDLEDKILDTLSSSEGNILEDSSAIEILDSARNISLDIAEKQKVAVQMEEMINKSRTTYKPIAHHTSILFFPLTELPNIDPMYQYGLSWFINLFIATIETSPKSKVLEKRVKNLKDNFTYNLYTNVCRSLFEKDKLLFSFVLCMSMMLAEGLVSIQQYQFLLTGGMGLENKRKNPAPEWLSKLGWDEICRIESTGPSFKGFVENFEKNVNDWKSIYDSEEPDLVKLPAPWDAHLSDFENMMTLRCIRADKLVPKIRTYVSNNMGAKFTSPPPFDLVKSYGDSSAITPLVFILSPGVDPMAALLKLADDMEIELESISLGQGQGPIARRMVGTAFEEGTWVCLQNCHLAASWMADLEKICDELPASSHIKASFRLWLTSYPSPKFPVSILQSSVKMTNEPPKGLRQNLLQSYLNDPISDAEFYAGVGTGKEIAFVKLLYSLCFFHAVVQERLKFGPIGWNIPYGFNASDLQISIQQLQMFLNEYTSPYEALRYLIGECNYGGRVTDDWDRRTLNTILADFINPNVVSQSKYPFSPSGIYHVPINKQSHEEFLDYIKKLPAEQKPEVFGMHSNVDISKELRETKEMCDSLLQTIDLSTTGGGGGGEEEGGGGGGGEGNKIVDIAADILSKLPPYYNLDEALKKYPTKYEESMNTVLVQEMDRFNILLKAVKSSLIEVQKAVKGFVIMTPELDTLSTSLLNNKLPDLWKKRSYPSLKPLAGYVSDLVERLNVLKTWEKEGKPNVFWISGFFFTQAFLTGAMQNHARKYKVPIDKLGFDFMVTKEFSATVDPPEDGVYIRGLFLDGASWNEEESRLDEMKPKVLHCAMPNIWLMPKRGDEILLGTRYKSPLYKTSERRGVLSTTGHSTNYVIPIMLDTKEPDTHWIKRGVALLCQLDA